MKVTPIEAGNRIQIPQDWAVEFGLTDLAALEKTDHGIVIQAYTKVAWDDIFASKLPPGKSETSDESFTLTGDDLIV